MSDGTSVPSGASGSFDDIQAELDALIRGFGGEPPARAPVPRPEPVPQPEPRPEPVPQPEPEPEPEPAPVPEPEPAPVRVQPPVPRPDPVPAVVVTAEPGPTRSERLRAVAALLGARLRKVDPVRDRRVRTLMIAVLAVGALVVVAGLLVSSIGDGDDLGLPALPQRPVFVPDLRFPDPDPGALAPEAPERPVGIRSLEVGFEAPIVAETELPSCVTHDPDRERVVWFNATGAGEDGQDGGLVAVPPGGHGVAVLLGSADPGNLSAPFRAIDSVRVGATVEIARVNGTIIRWRVIDVVDVEANSIIPDSVLVPVAEQRLLIAACGIVVGEQSRDRYVLALRDR